MGKLLVVTQLKMLVKLAAIMDFTQTRIYQITPQIENLLC